MSLAQQKRAWEELNRIFGGATPTPPGPGPDPPDPPTPVISDWSVYFSDQPADIQEIFMDEDVQGRLITVDYQEETMPEPVPLPFFTLYGGPGEFAVLITEIENVEPCEGARMICGFFRSGEFIQQYADAIPTVSKVNHKLLVEMFSCDGMGIVTYLSNFNPDGEFGSQMWSYTYSYDWAEGDFVMTRVSACDGRYLSLAQQKRAWEELNRIFGGETPTPPGPDPDPPDPPAPRNSLFVSPFGVRFSWLLSLEELADRIRYLQVQPEIDPDLTVPMFVLSGAREVVCCYTYVYGGETPYGGCDCTFGKYSSDSVYTSEFYFHQGQPVGSPEFLRVEIFYCDGVDTCYYLENRLPGEDVIPLLDVQSFEYDRAAGERPAVCFQGFTAHHADEDLTGYLLTFIASLSDE